MEQEFIEEELHKLFEDTLNYAEMVIPHHEIYKRFRTRFLRSGNNCLRNLLEGKNASERGTYEGTETKTFRD